MPLAAYQTKTNGKMPAAAETPDSPQPKTDSHLCPPAYASSLPSPGGSIPAGMAIYDTMKFIKCDVSTICIGMAASMGAFLLAGGTKGKRMALPNAEIMIHQPLGGAQGQATDIEINAKHILKTKERMNRILAENTGKEYEVIAADTERDNWKTAEEALADRKSTRLNSSHITRSRMPSSA